MEGVAWLTHKYIMHGILWNWHESHHVHHKNPLEKNDLFSVVFGISSTLTIIVGAEIPAYWPLFYIGLGIATYGIFYFIFHDIIVHRRIKIKYKAGSAYMKRIMKAHYVHHEVHTKKAQRLLASSTPLKNTNKLILRILHRRLNSRIHRSG